MGDEDLDFEIPEDFKNKVLERKEQKLIREKEKAIALVRMSGKVRTLVKNYVPFNIMDDKIHFLVWFYKNIQKQNKNITDHAENKFLLILERKKSDRLLRKREGYTGELSQPGKSFTDVVERRKKLLKEEEKP